MKAKSPRILVVDDDPGLAEVIELLLTREGYAAERAGTVRAALERVDGAEPDLVITDLKLPDGTGLDVIRHLHAERPIAGSTQDGQARPGKHPERNRPEKRSGRSRQPARGALARPLARREEQASDGSDEEASGMSPVVHPGRSEAGEEERE